MTAPRQVLPGVTYLITRRCARRQFLLRPSSTVNSVFLFVLAVAARRFGIQIHTFCVLSNHWHAVVTDPEAQLPDFVKYLNSLTARALNASMGLWENLFAGSSSYSAVTLVSPQDKAAYVLANPVTAGLVRRGKDWPGLWSGVERIGGGPISAKRPKIFFRPDGPTPDIADFELTCPPGFESAAAFRDQLAVALEERERQVEVEFAREGRRFLGRYAVLQQSPDARPRSGEPRRGLNPRIAARDKWKRMEALLRLKSFLKAYREAWVAFKNGVRDVLFPAGTYWLRVHQLVCCAAPG